MNRYKSQRDKRPITKTIAIIGNILFIIGIIFNGLMEYAFFTRIEIEIQVLLIGLLIFNLIIIAEKNWRQ
jgi:hypothetical protein